MKDDVLGRNSAPTTAPVPTSLANQEPSLRLRRTAEPRSCDCERLVYLLVTVLTPAHVRVSVIEALRLFRYIWLYVFLSLIFAYTLFGLGQILEIYRVLADQFLVASDLFRSGPSIKHSALPIVFRELYPLCRRRRQNRRTTSTQSSKLGSSFGQCGHCQSTVDRRVRRLKLGSAARYRLSAFPTADLHCFNSSGHVHTVHRSVLVKV